MGQIDIVIPHVDGDAPGYEALCREHIGEFIPTHARDLGELRYVLRSIDQHAPWARVTLVVQSEGHVPAWIDRDVVRVVLHAEFIPADLLPTFHWATISAHMHLIPDLSDRYIIWEDDVLAGIPRDEHDFFDVNGVPETGGGLFPIIPSIFRRLGIYERNLVESQALIHRMLDCSTACIVFPHAPLPVNRHLWRAFFDAFCEDPVFLDTVTRKRRTDERTRATVDPTVVFANWIEITQRRHSSLRRYAAATRQLVQHVLGYLRWPMTSIRRPFMTYAVVNDITVMDRRMRALLREQAVYINVNDDAHDPWDGATRWLEVNPRSVQSLERTLASLFPRPSRFERAIDMFRSAESDRPAH